MVDPLPCWPSCRLCSGSHPAFPHPIPAVCDRHTYGPRALGAAASTALPPELPLPQIIGNFGTVFVDQAYWMGAIASKPSASYKVSRAALCVHGCRQPMQAAAPASVKHQARPSCFPELPQVPLPPPANPHPQPPRIHPRVAGLHPGRPDVVLHPFHAGYLPGPGVGGP